MAVARPSQVPATRGERGIAPVVPSNAVRVDHMPSTAGWLADAAAGRITEAPVMHGTPEAPRGAGIYVRRERPQQ